LTRNISWGNIELTKKKEIKKMIPQKEKDFFKIKAVLKITDKEILVSYCRLFKGIYPQEIANFVGCKRDRYKALFSNVQKKTIGFKDFYDMDLMEKIAVKELRREKMSFYSIARFLAIPIERVVMRR